MGQLHGTVSNIVVVSDDDSAYSSQDRNQTESDSDQPCPRPHSPTTTTSRRPPSPVVINTRRAPSPTVIECYNTSQDPFKKQTLVVAHGFIYGDSISEDPKEQKIFDTGMG